MINKYITIIKYIFSAGISFVTDLALFTIFSHLFKIALGSFAIIIATILARIISSTVNYKINKNVVFSKKNLKSSKTVIQYFTLVVVQMLVSSFTVFTLFNLTHIDETFIKIPVECVLFVINYFIQKLFIFNDREFKMPKQYYKIINLVLAIISSFSLTVKLDIDKIIITSRHDNNTFLCLILGLLLFQFYQNYLQKTKKYLGFKILSIIFSLLLIFGYSYDTIDSAQLVIGNKIFIIISVIKFIGFYFLINCGLNVIFEKIKNSKLREIKKNKFVRSFEKKPFLWSIFIMFICYLPYIIAFYPAIMGFDPANQIKEFLGIPNRYLDSVNLLNPDVTITNFNPVLHTLLLGSCFKIGINIDNVNLGLFLYSIIQIITTLSILGYSIKFLHREKVPLKIIFAILMIYSLVPIFPFYALSTNKDMFFSLLMLLYIIKIYELIKYENYDFKNWISLIIISTFLFLSRNNGIYTIFLSLPIAFFILKDKRKYIFSSIMVITLFYIGYNKVILPHFEITSTSVREMLSIPFQQTANLIVKDEKLISVHDKKIISQILDYDVIKKAYDPELADHVKNTFNKNSTDDDLNAYFKVWIKYLFLKPSIYMNATINNVYGYFYPDTNRWYLYYTYNKKLAEAGFDYHFNNFKTLRNVLSGYGQAFQYIPVLNVFVNIGLSVWIYLYLVVILLVDKNKKMILLLTPALSLILVCVASPANAYFRYALPYILSLPLVVALLYKNTKKTYD